MDINPLKNSALDVEPPEEHRPLPSSPSDPTPQRPGLRLSSRQFALGGVLYWTLFCVLSLLLPGQPVLKVLLGFPALVLLPGTFLADLLGLHGRRLWENVLYRVALSLLSIMLGLGVTNSLLPALGLSRPLDPLPLTVTLWLLVTALGLLTLRSRHAAWETTWTLPRLNAYDLGVTALGLSAVALSALGATSLNNGGPNTLTLGMLLLCGATIVFLLIGVRRFNRGFLEFGFYLVSLSLLMMTSLRGWFTTGHDVQRELRVFELAKNAGNWAIERYRDSYNACLSITLLPTSFSHLFQVSEPYVYKVLFQLLFALVPVGVYLFIRQNAAKRFSLLACTYFLAFPTFFGDMPMLNRQEIGFLFLICMLLVLVNTEMSVQRRRWIFMLLGVGLVVSHYSTTYATIFALSAAWSLSVLYRFLLDKTTLAERLHGRLPRLKNLASPDNVKLITLPMVLSLILVNFLWVNLLTQTSSGIKNLFFDTIETVTGQRRGSEQSSDVGYSILFAKKFDPQASLNEFAASLVKPTRDKAPPGVYYSLDTLKTLKVTALEDPVLPLTSAGKAMEKAGINVLGFNYGFRQGAARILQLLILIGLGYYFFSRKNLQTLPLDIFNFTIGCLVFIGLIVVLPFLSVEYGLLRAFQQALIVLSPFIVLGINALFYRFRRRTRIMVTLGFSLTFFFSMTGIIPQLLGGYYPQLHLNNSGKYYDIYYVHEAEVAGIRWLAEHTTNSAQTEVQTDVQTDRYAVSRLNTFVPLQALDDLYPGLLRKQSYVFLGYSHLRKQEATVNYKGDLLTYKYPIGFLDAQKDTIYDNQSARVYR